MKKTVQLEHSILPSAGYVLTRNYIPKEKSVFVPIKETDGFDQKSEVIAVGDKVTDSNGVDRFPPCKVEDIIIHAASMSEFEIDMDKYRFVHFTQVHGVWEGAK